MKDQSIYNIMSNRVILSEEYRILWVVSLEMNENQYIVSFLNEKS